MDESREGQHMPERQPIDRDASEARQPAITKEIAMRLVREGMELRRQFRRRIESMWNISSEQRQIRTR